MYLSLNPELKLKNSRIEKPLYQDIMCVIFFKDKKGNIYPDNKLHFWNGFAWWPCDGLYYDEIEAEKIHWNNIEDSDVEFFLPIFPM